MFQRKTRVFPVLALTALLFLVPFAPASAAEGDSSEGSLDLVSRLETEVLSLWGALTGIWSEVGVRIDDNG